MFYTNICLKKIFALSSLKTAAKNAMQCKQTQEHTNWTASKGKAEERN